MSDFSQAASGPFVGGRSKLPLDDPRSCKWLIMRARLCECGTSPFLYCEFMESCFTI